jgi:Ca2+-binding RTX toxin-like protein
VIVFLLALLLAAPAQAATVKADAECDHFCSVELTYAAAPGEVNDLTITHAQDGIVQFHDAGATVTGCTAVDASTVRCQGGLDGDTTHVDADLGDGDDTFHGDASVDGGPGSDLLVSATGADFVDRDGAEPDRYVGPARVDYGFRRDDLRIDLRAGRVMPDGDTLQAVSEVAAGSGDDVLIGSDHRDVLTGGYGSDRLLGLGGDDELATGVDRGGDVDDEGRGRDVVEGGAGNDTITVTSRHDAGNVLRCGSGRDDLDLIQREDFVSGDCERIGVGESSRVRIFPRGRVFIRDPDRGRLVARSGHLVVARGTGKLALNAAGRALLARRGRLKVSVSLLGPDPGGFRMQLRR